MSDQVPMSREGYNKIKAEIDHLENVEMPAIAEKIASARSEGDLSENAEYHAQRENQGMLQAKINLLRDKLARATIIDVSKINQEEIAFGATVVVKDLDFDEEETYTLVGAGEEDYDSGKILVTSPIGQGLIGKKVGDSAEIPVPKGTIKYEIVKIEYDFG
ncbi:MAG: transcription elongation factor GreA [Pirellulaceae bacterium]|nr:transcription elongation factor GreA [Pirellulaceae bacterium]